MLLGSDDVQTDLDGNACFRIFLTTAYCGAPPGPPRPRDRAMPAPRGSTTYLRQKNGPQRRTRRAGGVEKGAPEDGFAWPPLWWGTAKIWKSQREYIDCVCEQPLAAASTTAVLLHMVGGWVGGPVVRGCNNDNDTYV